jgi:hypothetical protein
MLVLKSENKSKKILTDLRKLWIFLEVVWNILDTFFIGHFDQRSTKFK